MEQRTTLKERGAALILFCMMLFMFLGFAALSIDLGYLYMIKGQLQNAADAAALAGAGQLPNTATAITTAQNVAGLNLPNNGTILALSDILIGTWNASTNTLTSGGTNMSISVTTRRSTANGNPIALFFAPVLGISSSDLSATAVATKTTPSLTNGVVGLNSVNMSGGTWVDSYNASQGPYSSSTATNLAGVASNKGISLSGSATIKGNAQAGPGYSVSLSGGAAVTGSTSVATQTTAYATPPVPTSYNNNGLSKNLNVSRNKKLTMTPGTYYLSSLTIANSGSINITGPTTIYVSGNVNISGAGFINQAQLPSNLNIFITSTSGSTVKISGSAAFCGLIYAPTASLNLSGAAAIYGGFIGSAVTITGSGAIHLDKSLNQPFASSVIRLNK